MSYYYTRNCIQACTKCFNCQNSNSPLCTQSCKKCSTCYYKHQFQLPPITFNSNAKYITNDNNTYDAHYPDYVYPTHFGISTPHIHKDNIDIPHNTNLHTYPHQHKGYRGHNYEHNWYPNPLVCKDVCSSEVCDKYKQQIRNYRGCRECQRNDPPKCWNPKTNQCTSCHHKDALKSCNKSQHPLGFPNSNIAPVNPMYNKCKLS